MTRIPAVLASLVLLLGCSPREEPEPRPVVAVKVAPATLEDVRRSVRAPALIHPRQQAAIASRLTAAVRELQVRKGDRVRAGQLLARLENRDILAQRAEAEAALHQAQALAASRTRLFEEGAIPQRDLLATQTELLQTKARLEGIEAQLRFTELLGPFDGLITEQFLYPGDMAQPSSPVFTVADLSLAVARAQVPESEAAAIRAGQSGLFVPADSPGESYEGRVTVVNRAVDPSRQAIEVWCEIPNAKTRLLPGAFGELRILTATSPKSVVVPLAAVQFAEGTRKGSVLVVDDQKVAHRREVAGGEVFDGKVQIVEGLKAGEAVVVEGGYGLPDGTSVRILPAQPERPVAEVP